MKSFLIKLTPALLFLFIGFESQAVTCKMLFQEELMPWQLVKRIREKLIVNAQVDERALVYVFEGRIVVFFSKGSLPAGQDLQFSDMRGVYGPQFVKLRTERGFGVFDLRTARLLYKEEGTARTSFISYRAKHYSDLSISYLLVERSGLFRSYEVVDPGTGKKLGMIRGKMEDADFAFAMRSESGKLMTVSDRSYSGLGTVKIYREDGTLDTKAQLETLAESRFSSIGFSNDPRFVFTMSHGRKQLTIWDTFTNHTYSLGAHSPDYNSHSFPVTFTDFKGRPVTIEISGSYDDQNGGRHSNIIMNLPEAPGLPRF